MSGGGVVGGVWLGWGGGLGVRVGGGEQAGQWGGGGVVGSGVGGVGLVQGVVGLAEVVVGDAGVVEVDGAEEGLAEQAADGVRGLGVEAADVGEEVQAGVEDIATDGQALVGVLFSVFEAVAFLGDVGEAAAGGSAGEGAVGDEVDEVVLLAVQGGQLAGDAVVELADGGLVAVESVADLGLGGVGEGGAEGEGVHVAFQMVLDQVDGEVG